jgi:hypothetical protein
MLAGRLPEGSWPVWVASQPGAVLGKTGDEVGAVGGCVLVRVVERGRRVRTVGVERRDSIRLVVVEGLAGSFGYLGLQLGSKLAG